MHDNGITREELGVVLLDDGLEGVGDGRRDNVEVVTRLGQERRRQAVGILRLAGKSLSLPACLQLTCEVGGDEFEDGLIDDSVSFGGVGHGEGLGFPAHEGLVGGAVPKLGAVANPGAARTGVLG